MTADTDFLRQLRESQPRILIVEDEPVPREILMRALANRGYHLTEASAAEEALEHFRAHGADLVLSDLNMRGMTGIDLLRQVKAQEETTGFIMITGAGTMEHVVEALRLHADDYLLKPFVLDEVIFAVERALTHRRLLRENRYYQQQLEARVTEQAEQIERMFVDALRSLANAIEARDGYTGGHIERVTRIALAIGREMGLGAEELRALWVAALLHDVGKIGVPDQILQKPGPLTEEEYEEMKRHPEMGAVILQRSSFLAPAIPAVLHHQERWDGTGYPGGLAGEEISLAGRILAVADTFDAITSPRSYRPTRDDDAAIEEIRRCSGTQFDPAVVDAFMKAWHAGFTSESSERLVSRFLAEAEALP